MARKAAAKSPPSPPVIDSISIVGVKVSARKLITLDEDCSIWKGKAVKLYAEEWVNSIVRLRPPTDATLERIELVKDALGNAGVARIKLEQRRGVVIPNEAIQKAKPTRCSAREVVVQIVSEANSSNQARLLEIVERVMSEEGL